MSFTLNEYLSKNTTRRLFSIATNSNFKYLAHWWLTGFLFNVNLTRHTLYSRNLQMKAQISFNDAAMANMFYKNLRTFGWTRTKITYNYRRGEISVDIEWSSYGCILNRKFDKIGARVYGKS